MPPGVGYARGAGSRRWLRPCPETSEPAAAPPPPAAPPATAAAGGAPSGSAVGAAEGGGGSGGGSGGSDAAAGLRALLEGVPATLEHSNGWSIVVDEPGSAAAAATAAAAAAGATPFTLASGKHTDASLAAEQSSPLERRYGSLLCSALAHYEISIAEGKWVQGVVKGEGGADKCGLKLIGGRLPGSSAKPTEDWAAVLHWGMALTGQALRLTAPTDLHRQASPWESRARPHPFSPTPAHM